MGKVDFKLDDARLKTNLATFGPRINKYITVTTDFGGQQGTREMKLKAPWTDRTGAARAGLNTKVDHTGTSAIGFKQHSIRFAHGVDYGIWLEVANSGAYQIIMPTVLAVGREVMKTLNQMFAQLDSTPHPHVTVDMPGVRRRGTSQGTRQAASREGRRTRRSTSTGSTRRTRRT